MKNRKWLLLLSLMVLVWLAIKSATGIGRLFSASRKDPELELDPAAKRCSDCPVQK